MQLRRRAFLTTAGASAIANAGLAAEDPILEPDLPIIDPHHHMWDRPGATNAFSHFLLPDLLEQLNTGHKIIATVFIEAGSMYRADSPAELKSLGETEFATGQAAMSASGAYGPIKAVAGIVGNVDLQRGARAGEIMEMHKRIAGPRFKGIRYNYAHTDVPMPGRAMNPKPAHLLADPIFREGFAQLAPHGLSYDGTGYDPQLPELVDLARAFPETTIILNHASMPFMMGFNPRPRADVFKTWARDMRLLAKCANVNVKLGGFGLPGPPAVAGAPKPGAAELAALWKPYIETSIEAFGAERCMFESNYPSDAPVCSYRTIWNVFKSIAAKATPTEKAALFAGTAKRVYRLDI
jgi:L-fuconolactonase